MSIDTRFKSGDPRIKTGGRRKGSRDRIARALLEALAADFEEHGAEAVKIARMEKPTEYLRVIASLLPKEFEITTNNSLRELSDDEIDEFISRLRTERAVIRSSDPGESETTH